jgi:hypothetical protein
VPTFNVRRLPHYHAIDQPIFLTWRLHGSLPSNRFFPPTITSGQAFVAMDRLLDNARTGPLYLRQPEIAAMVVEAIRYRQDLGSYQLHAFVVMANHVHLLITPHVEVSRLMHSLKRFTAREAIGCSATPGSRSGRTRAMIGWSVPADRALYRDESGEGRIGGRA